MSPLIKIGDQYYAAEVDTFEGVVRVELWIITAIRAGSAYACRKDEFTWVKVSTKTGDYGWSSHMSDYDRRKFKLDAGPPPDWAKTKAAAYTKALPEVDAAIKKLTKVRSQMLGRRTKLRNSKAKKAAA